MKVCKNINRRADKGFILILVLGMVGILMILGSAYLGVSSIENDALINQKEVLQAEYIAEAGLEEALVGLSADLNWGQTPVSGTFAGGSYIVEVINIIDFRPGDPLTEVEINSVATYKNTSKELTVYAQFYDIDEGGGEITVWATQEGVGDNEWRELANAIDSSSGPNGTYAKHKMGQSGKNVVNLTGFDVGAQGSPITKVEAVIYLYVTGLTDDYLRFRWEDENAGENGAYHIVSAVDLNVFDGLPNAGYLYVDVTNDEPAAGWNWGYFASGSSFELNIESFNEGSSDRAWFYADAVGFRISW